MASTAWKSPSTLSQNGGDFAWSNLSNVASSDNNRASATGSKGATHWIISQGFGFTTSDIPSGSTIDGIEVAIERYASQATDVNGHSLELLDATGSVPAGSDSKEEGDWPDTESTYTAGGATDTWNWTGVSDSDIRDVDFGVRFSNWHYLSGDKTSYVDHVQIRVHYTAPAAAGGGIDVFNGATWDTQKPVKTWNGSAWITKPLKRWNSTAWVET